MKKIFSALLVLVLVVGLLAPLTPRVSAATPFNPNNLMDDFTFENTGTMSAGSIDSWLNSNFASGCITPSTGFTTADPQGWSDAQNKYLFGSSVSGGQAVHDVAVNYNINPQVILTTLQKEQSIVTGGVGCHSNSPDPATAANSPCGTAKTPCTIACPYSGGCMNIAMSYGCPNYCSVADEGFSMQLTLGTWLLRFGEQRAYGNLTGYKGYETGDQNFTYSGPMTQGYRQRVAGGSTIYYDGSYTTSDGTSVTITNGTTASLYYYTPFISGNLSFDNIFQGAISDGYLGFGSVSATDTFTAHPNGTLVASGGKVYLISNNTRQWITNGDVFQSYYGWGGWSLIKPASIGDANLPAGANISTLAPGTIFRSTNTPTYIMTYQSGSLVKQEISLAAFNALGYSWDQVTYVPPGEMPTATASNILFASAHPAGTLVVDWSNGRTYLLDMQGGQLVKRYVYGPNAFNTNRFDWGKVKSATSADVALPNGTNVDIAQGTILLAPDGIYVADYDANGVIKRPFGPWECFAYRLHYSLSDGYPISSGAMPTRSGSLFTCS
ncbi:MAG TPA: hypothetical protein VFT49_03510 [Candidatus Saccharimonadales bacterium]|nr:hypothetical protein [Candidatus Saccharimonadales bacterium]